jgi:hypothetical protein
MIDASPPDWGDGKLGLPLVSIRPGIVARIGGEIPVPPYVRRGNTGGFRMARQHGTRQPAPGHRDGDDHRRGVIRRLARVTAMAAITAPLSSGAGAADRSLEAPAPGRRDGTIRYPALYPTRATECPSSEVWCRRSGARKSRGRMLPSGLGPAPPGSNMPPHSGLGCKGSE